MIDVLLIRGAPGAGKSTLARKLRDRLGAVLIEVDDVRNWRSDPDHSCPYQHTRAILAACRAASAFYGDAPVIIADTFCGGKLSVAQTALSDVCHLTLSLWLRSEILSRRTSPHCPRSSALAVNDEIGAMRWRREQFIDASDLSPDDLAAFAQAILCFVSKHTTGKLDVARGTG